MSDVQRAHDAELEAEAWKHTARRWRSRALQNASGWKRRARELETRLKTMEVEHAEEVAGLKKRLEEANLDAERDELLIRIRELDYKLAAKTNEEISVRRKATQHEYRVRALEGECGVAQRELAECRAHLGSVHTKEILPARARIRVIATRLGIDPSVPGYADDDWLTDRVDRFIVNMLGVIPAWVVQKIRCEVFGDHPA